MTRPQTTGELEQLRSLAYDVLRRDPAARNAHLRLYEVEQMLGRPDSAIEHLRAAVQSSRVVSLPALQQPAARSVLAFSRVAAFEANTPLELILDTEHTTLHRLYIDDGDTHVPDEELPPYDVLFNTIAESEQAQPALALAHAFAERTGRRPVNDPAIVAQLGRAGVAHRFAGSTTILAPGVERVEAGALRARDLTAPLVVRPVGSQAGHALGLVADRAELHAYLDEHAYASYFVTPFVDYRSRDGFYRKYRVMFVNGVPFAYHLAISPRWMIHYYNAPMADHQWMRDEEARFIDGLGAVFHGPLHEALHDIARGVALEYFGIDCGIAPDGRLLLFEADAAMLVHGTDAPDLFPYKRVGFERVKAALTTLLSQRGGSEC